MAVPITGRHLAAAAPTAAELAGAGQAVVAACLAVCASHEVITVTAEHSPEGVITIRAHPSAAGHTTAKGRL